MGVAPIYAAFQAVSSPHTHNDAAPARFHPLTS